MRRDVGRWVVAPVLSAGFVLAVGCEPQLRLPVRVRVIGPQGAGVAGVPIAHVGVPLGTTGSSGELETQLQPESLRAALILQLGHGDREHLCPVPPTWAVRAQMNPGRLEVLCVLGVEAPSLGPVGTDPSVTAEAEDVNAPLAGDPLGQEPSPDWDVVVPEPEADDARLDAETVFAGHGVLSEWTLKALVRPWVQWVRSHHPPLGAVLRGPSPPAIQRVTAYDAVSRLPIEGGELYRPAPFGELQTVCRTGRDGACRFAYPVDTPSWQRVGLLLRPGYASHRFYWGRSTGQSVYLRQADVDHLFTTTWRHGQQVPLGQIEIVGAAGQSLGTTDGLGYLAVENAVAGARGYVARGPLGEVPLDVDRPQSGQRVFVAVLPHPSQHVRTWVVTPLVFAGTPGGLPPEAGTDLYQRIMRQVGQAVHQIRPRDVVVGGEFLFHVATQREVSAEQLVADVPHDRACPIDRFVVPVWRGEELQLRIVDPGSGGQHVVTGQLSDIHWPRASDLRHVLPWTAVVLERVGSELMLQLSESGQRLLQVGDPVRRGGNGPNRGDLGMVHRWDPPSGRVWVSLLAPLNEDLRPGEGVEGGGSGIVGESVFAAGSRRGWLRLAPEPGVQVRVESGRWQTRVSVGAVDLAPGTPLQIEVAATDSPATVTRIQLFPVDFPAVSAAQLMVPPQEAGDREQVRSGALDERPLGAGPHSLAQDHVSDAQQCLYAINSGLPSCHSLLQVALGAVGERYPDVAERLQFAADAFEILSDEVGGKLAERERQQRLQRIEAYSPRPGEQEAAQSLQTLVRHLEQVRRGVKAGAEGPQGGPSSETLVHLLRIALAGGSLAQGF